MTKGLLGFDELKKFLLNNIATDDGPKITIPVGNFIVRDRINGRIYTRKSQKTIKFNYDKRHVGRVSLHTCAQRNYSDLMNSVNVVKQNTPNQMLNIRARVRTPDDSVEACDQCMKIFYKGIVILGPFSVAFTLGNLKKNNQFQLC